MQSLTFVGLENRPLKDRDISFGLGALFLLDPKFFDTTTTFTAIVWTILASLFQPNRQRQIVPVVSATDSVAFDANVNKERESCKQQQRMC